MPVLNSLLALSVEESLRRYHLVNEEGMSSNFTLWRTEEVGPVGANIIFGNTL